MIQTKLKSSAGRYLTNSVWLMIERFGRLGLAFFLSIWLARYLGPEQFGAYSFALVLCHMFALFSILGVNKVMFRELIQRPQEKEKILSTGLVAVFLGSSASSSVLYLTIFFGAYDNNIVTLIIVLSFMNFLQIIFVLESYFHSQSRGREFAFVGIIVAVLTNGLRALGILFEMSLIYFALLVLFEIALTILLHCTIIYRDGVRLRLSSIAKSDVTQLVSESWPYMFVSFFIFIYHKIDTFMIMEMLGPKSVGEYAAGTKLTDAWSIVSISLITSLFPAILNARTRDLSLYKSRLDGIYFVFILLSAIAAGSTYLIADHLIDFLFGAGYSNAGSVLAIHIWTIVFVFVGVANAKWLLAEGLQKYSMINTCIGAISNIVLNLILIPRYGLEGAAIATVISYAIAGYLALAIWPKTRPSFFAISTSLLSFPRLR